MPPPITDVVGANIPATLWISVTGSWFWTINVKEYGIVCTSSSDSGTTNSLKKPSQITPSGYCFVYIFIYLAL